ncbi:MAG TPA: hypothetical protein VLI54_05740 [Bacillota bacterium]|nr:hypothetical protein [Bacillota bacterium]
MSELFDHTLSSPEDQAAEYFSNNLPIRYVEVPDPLDEAIMTVWGELGRIQDQVNNPDDMRPDTADLRVALAYDEEAARVMPPFPRPYGGQLRPQTYIDPGTGRYSYDVSPRFLPPNPNDPVNNGLV